jgi:hypothetical protein
MQEGDKNVNPLRAQRVLAVCWNALVFRGGGGSHSEPRLSRSQSVFVHFVAGRVAPLVIIGAEELNEAVEGTSSKSHSVSAVFVPGRTTPQESSFDQLPNLPKPSGGGKNLVQIQERLRGFSSTSQVSRLRPTSKFNRCPPPPLADYSQPVDPTRLSCPIPSRPRCPPLLIPHFLNFVQYLAAAAGSPKPTSWPPSNSSPYLHPPAKRSLNFSPASIRSS